MMFYSTGKIGSKFHRESCYYAGVAYNKQYASYESALLAGLLPCVICKPQPTPPVLVPILKRTIYVAPDGDDVNIGSLAAPLRTPAKAISVATPGTTVFFRAGEYFQNIALGAVSQAKFYKGAKNEDERIYFKGEPGTDVVITSMRMVEVQEWNLFDPSKNIWSVGLIPQLGTPNPVRVPNMASNGVPLELLKESENGTPDLLVKPGQWCRDVIAMKAYVIPPEVCNPRELDTELCEFPTGGSSTIEMACRRCRNVSIPQSDYFTFQNLIFEGGWELFMNECNHIEWLNCTFRNCHGNGLKCGGAKPADLTKPDDPADLNYYNSEYCLVRGCQMYNFARSGFDLTGGDYWLVEDNHIHHGTPEIDCGFLMKNNARKNIVRRNRISDCPPAQYGEMYIGGSSWGDIYPEAQDCQVYDNCVGGNLMIRSTKNCVIYHNQITGTITPTGVNEGLVVEENF